MLLIYLSNVFDDMHVLARSNLITDWKLSSFSSISPCWMKTKSRLKKRCLISHFFLQNKIHLPVFFDACVKYVELTFAGVICEQV